MTDKTTIQTNVDTFNDGGGYFVRAEIEARSVNIHGPSRSADRPEAASRPDGAVKAVI